MSPRPRAPIDDEVVTGAAGLLDDGVGRAPARDDLGHRQVVRDGAGGLAHEHPAIAFGVADVLRVDAECVAAPEQRLGGARHAGHDRQPSTGRHREIDRLQERARGVSGAIDRDEHAVEHRCSLAVDGVEDVQPRGASRRRDGADRADHDGQDEERDELRRPAREPDAEVLDGEGGQPREQHADAMPSRPPMSAVMTLS